MRRVFVVAYRRFGQIIGPIFKGQAVQLEVPRSQVLLDCFTLKDGTDGLRRNVGNNYEPTPRYNPEERRPHLRAAEA